MTIEQTDVLVIGAGPSGAVAAATVHQSGLKVRVVEKQQFPRFVIGESLIPRCMEHFEEAGFMDTLNKMNFQKKYGAKFIRNGETCTFRFAEQYTKGWEWTWQVPRAEFDKALADNIVERGVPLSYQTTVTDIKFEGTDSITTIEDKDGNQSQIRAKFLIDASGWGRVMPRMFDLDEPSDFPSRTAMFTHVTDELRPQGEAGEQITFVILEQDVWLWIIPFSNGNTSLGFVGNPEFFARYEGTPAERFAQMLTLDKSQGNRFEQSEFSFEPRTLRGYASAVKKTYGAGYALTGNAAEFLDPVFSSGVTFGTESALRAGKLASAQIKGEAVDWETDYHQHIMQGVNTFRSYVKGWYDGTLHEIFFSENIIKQHKHKICSVLAGYVWDKSNPYVKKHNRAINTLYQVIKLQET